MPLLRYQWATILPLYNVRFQTYHPTSRSQDENYRALAIDDDELGIRLLELTTERQRRLTIGVKFIDFA